MPDQQLFVNQLFTSALVWWGCPVMILNVFIITTRMENWFVRIAFGIGSGCLYEIRVGKAKEADRHFERCLPSAFWWYTFN